MDSSAFKLLRQTQHQLQNIPKLLLLPTIFFVVAMVVFPDQPSLNPLNIMFYNSYHANSSTNATSSEATESNSSAPSPSPPTRESIADSYCSNFSSNPSSRCSVEDDFVPDTPSTKNDPTSKNDSTPSSNPSKNDHPMDAPATNDSRNYSKSSSNSPSIPTTVNSTPTRLNPSPKPSPTGRSSSTPNASAAAAATKNRSTTITVRDSIKTCDLFKGNWIPDPEAPYYTNLTCFMIQEHQNCMKFGRPDTDFLKWRWKPQDCEMTRFDPLSFLETVRGKSMAFVGDSLARNHMQSLLCLLSRVELPEDVDMGDIEIKRLFYAKYNFTITIFWSPYLVKAKELKKFGLWYIYLDEIDTKWASRLEEFDYLIVSGANWFTRPSLYFTGGVIHGCNYCQVRRYTIRSLHYANKMVFETVFRTINTAAKYKGLTIMRTVSPSHFENGPWNQGGNCRRTRPSRPGESKFQGSEQEMYKAQLDVFKAAKAEGRKKGLEFKLMDMTSAMLMRPDGHPDRYGHWPNEYVAMHNDCVHWCLPGPVDMWSELLQQMIRP